MKKIILKLISLASVLCLLLCFASCSDDGANEAESTTAYNSDYITQPSESTTAQSSAQTKPVEAESDVSVTAEEPSTSEQSTQETSTNEDETVADLNDKAYVVELYKKAAVATEKAGVTTDSTLTLLSMDGGEGTIGAVLDFFEPIAKAILADNSVSFDGLTGGHEKLSPDDVRSHKATVSADGRYTTVVLNLVPQTDGVDGKGEEGSVGHAVSVLDGVGIALDELAKKGINVDYRNGKILLNYIEPTVNVKIDNSTGRIVSGKWSYKADVDVDNVDVTMSIFSVTLRKAGGVVEYICSI